MNEYELLLHPREQDFREIDQRFAKLFGLATGIHEEIYSQHPIYLSCTSTLHEPFICSIFLSLIFVSLYRGHNAADCVYTG